MSTPERKPPTVNKSAVTGEFVSDADMEASPETTYRQTVSEPLRWTDVLPTVDGWYWHRPASWEDEDAIVVQVCGWIQGGEPVWYDHEPLDSYGSPDVLRERPLSEAKGLWAGPIPLPLGSNLPPAGSGGGEG